MARQMETTLFRIAVCGALLLMDLAQAVPQPSKKSMTYELEQVDHISEFSVRAKVYFSQKHQAYRYDFSGGQSKMFIYPREGKAYYYYPRSDFPNHKFNLTSCYEMDIVQIIGDLPSPLPSLEGFTDLGPDHSGDVPTEKFALIYDFHGDEILEEIWMVRQNGKVGDHPVKEVSKAWEVRQTPSMTAVKGELIKHTVTEYYGFSYGEPDSSVWERPGTDCTAATGDLSVILVSMAISICVQKELLTTLNEFTHPHTHKKYKTGRLLGEVSSDDPLQLPFPWSVKECEKMAKTLPKSFDWRDLGAVTGVKNQRQCGSCWAHSAVGALEGAYFLKTGELITLSEQSLVDCAGTGGPNGVNGCYGGWESAGFQWVNQTGGIPPTEEYSPYQETNGLCRVTNSTKLAAQVVGYYQIPSNTDALKVALVKLGPIAVGIQGPSFHYKHGVVTECDKRQVDHGVLLVGYGESDEHGPYWIIKNSWDTTWGLEGYFLMSAKGDCRGILSGGPVFPVLK